MNGSQVFEPALDSSIGRPAGCPVSEETAGSRQSSRVAILGAAGRDFHNFNVVFRDDVSCEVIAFTAAQIPGIEDRRYPPSLAGSRYPEGIPILPESALDMLVRERGVQQIVFSYSDVTHAEVMHLASRAIAAGADFLLLGPKRTMLHARIPVIAVSAVRTGCGKSQTARYLSRLLRERGLRVAVIRHPMPYGDLEAARVQRFASRRDLEPAHCTVEEREEYEPHLAAGNTVYAGTDYADVLQIAESESDLILWDGGNNDFPFIRPDLHIVLADALRPGQETTHHPGEAVLRMADVVVVAKSDAADPADVRRVADNVRAVNPHAVIVRGGSPVTLDDPGAVRGRRVLAVDDGPTLTHGGMPHGAAWIAAMRAGAARVIDPRPWAAPAIAAVFELYPHIGAVLPATGYSAAQLEALRTTIERSDAEVVVSGTPIDLGALLHLSKPVVRARYEYAEMETPGLRGELDRFLEHRLGRGETVHAP
jgi:predicted GTPase